MLANIKSHNYNFDSNLQNNKNKDAMVLPLFLFFNIPYSLAFVQLTRDTDEVSYQLFLALLVYQAYAKDS